MRFPIFTLGYVAATLMALATSLAAPASADVLDDVKARGVLKVGGKSDYKPFGFRQPDGSLAGMSVDLARRVADRLGVRLEIVPTTAANQLQFLEQGRVDVLIAAMNDTPERRKVVYIVEPGYYASGANLLAVASAGIRSWDDLKGKTVCATQGAYFNRAVQQDYGAKVVAFKAPTEAYNALRNGSCVGLVYDDNSLTQRLEDPEWAGYEMPLPSIQPQAVAMAVRLGETRFHDLLTEMSIDWYRSGEILKLEEKWFPGKRSSYVREMAEKYR